jgi:hypothetical protein
MGPRPQGYGDLEGVDCSPARKKPSRRPKVLAPHSEVQSLDENTRHFEDAAFYQQFEDAKVSSTNGKKRTEGVKRVTLTKRYLDGGVLMTRGARDLCL